MKARLSTFQWLPVDQIELDRHNPRIAKWLEMYPGEITAEQMSLALGASDSQTEEGSTTFYSLRESIKTNGGVIHPIIVNREPNGRLVAIEGNTRVLIYREFNKPGIEGEWDTIPSMVCDGLSNAQIDAIRLQAHLVGPRAWDPYSKAKYLNYLRHCEHLPFSQIVDFCGGRKREVLDYIAGYEDMEQHYRPLLESEGDFDASRFSAFVELQRPRVKEALLKAGFTKSDFAAWVKDGLISPLMTVRQLPRILENARSRDVFLTDGAQEAIKILDVPAPDAAIKDATLEQLALEISRRIRNITYAELQRLRASVGTKENEIICDARDQLLQFCSDIASSD